MIYFICFSPTADHEKEILCYLGSHQHNLSSFGVLRQREEISPGFRGQEVHPAVNVFQYKQEVRYEE